MKRNLRSLFRGSKPKSLFGGAPKRERGQYAQLLAVHRGKATSARTRLDVLTVYRKVAQLDSVKGNQGACPRIQFVLQTFCSPVTRKAVGKIVRAVYDDKGYKEGFASVVKTMIQRATGKTPAETRENLQRIIGQIDKTEQGMRLGMKKIKGFVERARTLRARPVRLI
ncbi:MAG: hypothetical protein PHD95_07215 [Candidatus ainarchaeum sp.]|nr:hypothetical protein [Candidatus ainarchaeum sp.]